MIVQRLPRQREPDFIEFKILCDCRDGETSPDGQRRVKSEERKEVGASHGLSYKSYRRDNPCGCPKSAKVGSDSEPSRGRLQPNRRAERDFCGKGGIA